MILLVVEKYNSNNIRTIPSDKELWFIAKFFVADHKTQVKKCFLEWLFTFCCLFLLLRIFLATLNNVECCAIPCNGESCNRFKDLVWAEKWRKKAEPTGTLQIHLMIINTCLSYFSEESVQFFHPEGQRKLQSNCLLVCIGQTAKKEKLYKCPWESKSSSHSAS